MQKNTLSRQKCAIYKPKALVLEYLNAIPIYLDWRENKETNKTTNSMTLFWVESDGSTSCLFISLHLKTLFPLAPPGDSDPYLWVSADARVVPADPGQTKGSWHHCAWIKQHCCHARRDLPCLQDWVLKQRAETLQYLSCNTCPVVPIIYKQIPNQGSFGTLCSLWPFAKAERRRQYTNVWGAVQELIL